MINMNNEEFEGKMAFIVEQQARFAVGIQQTRALQAKTENIVRRLEQATLVGSKDVNVKVKSLGALQDWLTEAQIQLTEARKQTDEKLKKLKKMVDRPLREGRNRN